MCLKISCTQYTKIIIAIHICFKGHLEDFLNNKQYGISIIKIHYQFYATLHN